MQQDSDGRQGQHNQGQNRRLNVTLYDQNCPQPRRFEDSTPIQEGCAYGQAYFTDAEHDGDRSMLYNNANQSAQAFHQPSSAVQNSSLQAEIENGTVMSQSSSVNSRQNPSFLGVDIRNATTPCQSASGFSASSMNQPSGGHLQQDNVQLQDIAEPGAVVDLRRLKEMLKQRLGAKYQKDIENCMILFQGSSFSGADPLQYAIQLLYYIDGDKFRCLSCKEMHNVGTVFRHTEDCIVHICSQEILNTGGDRDMRQFNLPNGTEGNINVPRRQEGDLQDTAARRPTNGATRGAPPSEETLYKASFMPGNSQTYSGSSSLTRGFATAPGPPPNQTAQNVHLTPDNFQTWNDSSSFTGGFATAPGPPQNRTAQNVHLTPAVSESSARFPMYQRHDRRLRTFNNWQHNHVQCPKALTDAGFFYREIDDECQCFKCGQVLRKWKVQDNPWSEHARHSPDCPFVMREKGQAFVNEVRKNTAKKEIRTPPTIFRRNAGRSEANPQRSYQAMIAEDNSLDCSLLEMGFTKEQIQVAINRFRKVNGSKEHTTEHLIEIIISDESQHGKDLSICGVCGIRKVRVSQSTCGHIVCIECAVHPGERCKFCDKPVVKRVLYEYDVNI